MIGKDVEGQSNYGKGGGHVEQGTDIESRGFSSPQTLEAHVWITNL